MENAPGRFITVEGIEGCGKTTILNHLYHLVIELGYSAIITREPGGTILGEQLRKIFLECNSDGMTAEAELLLLFAARAEHLARVIRPALASGKWVFCDRFTDATYAYQGGGRGIAQDRIAFLETWTQNELRPDLTLLLDLPVQIGFSRIQQRPNLDRFEQENFDFHERVRATYLKLAHFHPHRFRIINSELPLIEVKKSAERIVKEIIDHVGK